MTALARTSREREAALPTNISPKTVARTFRELYGRLTSPNSAHKQLQPGLSAGYAGSQPYPPAGLQQLRPSHNRRTHTVHTWETLVVAFYIRPLPSRPGI